MPGANSGVSTRRPIIILFAIVLVPTVVIPGAASLITQGINSAGPTINDMLWPLSQSGDAKLEGLIKLRLNLIFIAILVRFFVRR